MKRLVQRQKAKNERALIWARLKELYQEGKQNTELYQRLLTRWLDLLEEPVSHAYLPPED